MKVRIKYKDEIIELDFIHIIDDTDKDLIYFIRKNTERFGFSKKNIKRIEVII